ncbi:hypothetical protein ACSX1A_18550 [Pontibacter sp. MBLB2868]|uniref:hypothetical protein n=1 Tax=Pontibacter sp. MBLB2868 TaxID=3451555 RepID=UPI003F75707F
MRKNSILKSFLILGIGMITSVGAVAQNGQQGQMNQQERAERQTEQLKKRLALTDEQVVKLEEINKNTAETLMSLRNDQSLDRQSKMDRVKTIRDEREAAIVALLTDEQKQQYEVMQQNRQEKQVQRKGGRRGSK